MIDFWTNDNRNDNKPILRIYEPNMNKRAKPYLMGEHFCGLEIGLANFLRWVFGSFLVLLLQNILFLKCLRNMGVKITQTNICEPNMSFRAKNLNTEMAPVFKCLAKTECLYYIQYYCEIILRYVYTSAYCAQHFTL